MRSSLRPRWRSTSRCSKSTCRRRDQAPERASSHRWTDEKPMTRLPPEIRPVLENGTPGVMVTGSADGKPNTTVISQVYYVDERHAALSFQFFSKTIRSVRENPRAFVCVFDIPGKAH